MRLHDGDKALGYNQPFVTLDDYVHPEDVYSLQEQENC